MSTASDTVDKNKEKGGGVGEFIRDTRSEWDKTTFPSSDEVRNTTLIVLFSVIVIAIFLYLVDLFWVFLLATEKGPFNGVGLLVWVVNYLAGV